MPFIAYNKGKTKYLPPQSTIVVEPAGKRYIIRDEGRRELIKELGLPAFSLGKGIDPLTPYGPGGAALGALAGLGIGEMKTDRRGFFRKLGYASLGAAAGWLADVALGKYIEPKISEVGWKPTRVVNDKVYDISARELSFDSSSYSGHLCAYSG